MDEKDLKPGYYWATYAGDTEHNKRQIVEVHGDYVDVMGDDTGYDVSSFKDYVPVQPEAKPDSQAENEAWQLQQLISFWENSLAQHRLLMEPAAVALVEMTIKVLKTMPIIGVSKIWVYVSSPNQTIGEQ